MKFIHKILLCTLLAFAASSCGDMFDLDINEDPNNPSQASSRLLLTSSQYNLMADLANVSDNLLGFAGILASYDQWSIGQSDFNGFWGGMYADQLKDIEGLIQANEGSTGSPQYLGIAKIMKAFVLATMVDLFGDIPYSEALKGDAADKITSPKFDDDKTLYDEAFKLIEEGIANVNDPRRPVAVTGDIIYAGNAARWTSFANTLKLRMLLNTRLVNPTAKADIQAILDGGKFIKTDAEDFNFQFSKTVTPDNRHPWYQASYTSGTNGQTYILHQYMVEMLADKDPRISFYFRRITKTILDQADPSQRNTTPCAQTPACFYRYLVLNSSIHQQLYGTTNLTQAQKDYLAGFFGRDRADPAGIPLDGDLRLIPGVYPAGGFFDVANPGIPAANAAPGGGIFPALTSVNALYYQIEAILTLGVTGDARALFEKAIRDHIKKVVDFGVRTDANSTRPPYTRPDGVQVDIDAYVNLWLQRYDNAPGTDAKLNVVAKQLWFSSWGNGFDIYNMLRRTGLPSTLQQPILPVRNFPLRLPYPQQELTLNPNAAAYKDVIYDRDPIFWDAN